MRTLAALAALLLAGCAPTNIAELMKAMAGDQASVCWTITTIYGTAKMARSGLLNGTVNCSADGMAIKAAAPDPVQSVTVPLQVQPQQLAPVPRAVPQSAPRPSGRVTLTPIAWQPATHAPTSLSADMRLLLFSIGDLHGVGP